MENLTWVTDLAALKIQPYTFGSAFLDPGTATVMFQLSFIAIITLRVIFCPLLCFGCDDGAQPFQIAEAHVCSCDDSDREPCQEDGSPFPFDNPSECPCDTGCVSQAMPELNNRMTSVDLVLAVDLSPYWFVTIDASEGFAFRGEHLSHRLDLTSGRSVRLAHASLLL